MTTDSVASTIAAAIPEIMGSGQHAIAIEEIERVPPDSRLPVLGLVTSRIQMQRRDYRAAIEASHSILETVEPGSQESDYALLNLVTLYLQSGLGNESRHDLRAVAADDLQRTAPTNRAW